MFELALSVKAVARLLERWTNDAMRPLGVTGPQADALTVIAEAGPVSLRELGDLLIAESGHPSRLVDRLVAVGLVRRSTSDDDRRRVELVVSAKGRRVVRAIEAARREVLELGKAVLGDQDVTRGLGMCRTLLAGSDYAALIDRRRELASP
jgi:DNA-binding MarR family transcriptional regulator